MYIIKNPCLTIFESIDLPTVCIIDLDQINYKNYEVWQIITMLRTSSLYEAQLIIIRTYVGLISY